MHVLVAHYQTSADASDRVAKGLIDMRALSRQEPGCVAYDVHRSLDDSSRFMLYEIYLDEAAYDAHRGSPHFRRIVEGMIVPLLVSRERAFYRPLDGDQ